MSRHISWFIATGCYVGLAPRAPGTCASLATTLAFYLTHRVYYDIRPELHVSVFCLVALVGTWASGEVSRLTGSKDPQQIVIDEVAGQLLTFVFLPVHTLNLILGTVLFRVFDIFKPPPIRRLESLKNGVGIMSDDLMAGVYANLVLQVLNRWVIG